MSFKRGIIFVALVLIGLAVYLVPKLTSRQDQPTFASPPIVLISIDTCRADHLGCYNPDRPLTPNIDAFARNATVFDNAVAPIPMTVPSHGTMLTGKTPLVHGTHDNYSRISDENVMLAEILKDNGYVTGAVVGSAVMSRQTGTAQGFDWYEDQIIEAGQALPDRPAGQVAQLAMQWLDGAAQGDRPFFLFIHLYDPHTPYNAPQPFAGRHAGQPYAAEVAYTDHSLGPLLDKLRSLGLYDQSMIILTADHGEMLGEHGELDHGYFIYQSAIRIPLIIKLPNQETGRRIKDIVGLVDLVPTVCSQFGFDAPEDVQGIDLLDYLASPARVDADRYLFIESLSPLQYYRAHPLSGLVGNRWKYIHSLRPELYDLQADPDEAKNIFLAQRGRARSLDDARMAAVEQSEDIALKGERADIDPQREEILAGLGYTGGPQYPDAATATYDADAKDLVDLHREFHSEVSQLRASKRPAEAAALCERLAKQHPQAPRIHLTLAELLGQLGRHEKAVEACTRAIELAPNDPAGYLTRARAYGMMGRPEKALPDGLEAIRLDPNRAIAHTIVGMCQVELKDYPAAGNAYRRVLEINSTDLMALVELSHICLEELDNPAEAEPLALRALELDPGNSMASKTAGWALARLGKYRQARDYLQRSVQLTPSSTDYYRLGYVLERLGETDQARKHYEFAWRRVGSQPDHPLFDALREAVQRLEEP